MPSWFLSFLVAVSGPTFSISHAHWIVSHPSLCPAVCCCLSLSLHPSVLTPALLLLRSLGASLLAAAELCVPVGIKMSLAPQGVGGNSSPHVGPMVARSSSRTGKSKGGLRQGGETHSSASEMGLGVGRGSCGTTVCQDGRWWDLVEPLHPGRSHSPRYRWGHMDWMPSVMVVRSRMAHGC